MPVRRSNDEVQLDKYFDRKFFCKPFICTKCGNEVWFERGLVPDRRLALQRTGGHRFSDGCLYRYLTNTQYEGVDKFCDLCSKDIEYIFKKFDSKVVLNKLGDWLDGVPVGNL